MATALKSGRESSLSQKIIRRKTHQVQIAEDIWVGSEHPVLVQSMTNTLTADVDATVKQVKELFLAGSRVVRLTVNDEPAAQAIPEIDSRLRAEGLIVPLVGDFHYNGHLLLRKYPDCAKVLAKYRINPGNVGFGDKHDENFAEMVKVAIENDKPVRIGVNWGSLDQDLLTELMDENSKRAEPWDAKEVLYEAIISSALNSAAYAEKLGLAADKIIISAKVSEVQDLITVYRELARRCDYPLHLGLTEAGTPVKGMIASSVSLGILLQEGIGDTIRMSLTPLVDEKQEAVAGRANLHEESEKTNPLSRRTLEVEACQILLQSMGLAFFKPQVTSCPGCGRTSSTFFQSLAEDINEYIAEQMPTWKEKYPGVEKLKIAVMGCIVNGPGESKHADIGISLPGNNEEPSAPIYIDGKQSEILRGDNIASEFKEILDKYIESKFA